MTTEFRNRATHAVTLASGRSLAPGEAAAISDDPHDRTLLDEGSLILVDETVDYDRDHTRESLANIADGRGLTVKGTGQSGDVLKADLVRALQADDKKGS